MIGRIFKSALIIFFILLVIICADQNEDKLVLNPLELIDLVIKERKNKNMLRVWCGPSIKKSSYVFKERAESTTELNEDEKTLKARKVWSRWDKWGHCSVTCGFGTISRQRLCVAGRCAPGEREEQLRPCTRAPCAAPLGTIAEELLELD